MMRVPHRYGMGRSVDADAGGAADLQTDVMRFMAILALCLVVIFALVQSIPRPVPTAPEPVAETVPPESVREPEPVSAPVAPAPEPTPEPEPEVVVLTRSPAPVVTSPQPVVTPEPMPAAAQPPTPSPPPPPPPPPPQEGFTLQFESDTALTRLVGRNAIGLFALDDTSTLRMSFNRGRVSFWPASLPNAYHEMDPGTVPDDVLRALRLTRGGDSRVTWGVTLPANMQRELDAIVREHRGGALYIAGDGQIRLEP
ncbi:MAG: hypothetical protein AAGA41_01975 [Pseudomonadota bacterium]